MVDGVGAWLIGTADGGVGVDAGVVGCCGFRGSFCMNVMFLEFYFDRTITPQ